MPDIVVKDEPKDNNGLRAQVDADGALAGQFWADSLVAMDKFMLDLVQLVQAAVTDVQNETQKVKAEAVAGILASRADAIHGIRATWSDAIADIKRLTQAIDDLDFEQPHRLGGYQEFP